MWVKPVPVGIVPPPVAEIVSVDPTIEQVRFVRQLTTLGTPRRLPWFCQAEPAPLAPQIIVPSGLMPTTAPVRQTSDRTKVLPPSTVVCARAGIATTARSSKGRKCLIFMKCYRLVIVISPGVVPAVFTQSPVLKSALKLITVPATGTVTAVAPKIAGAAQEVLSNT